MNNSKLTINGEEFEAKSEMSIETVNTVLDCGQFLISYSFPKEISYSIVVNEELIENLIEAKVLDVLEATVAG